MNAATSAHGPTDGPRADAGSGPRAAGAARATGAGGATGAADAGGGARTAEAAGGSPRPPGPSRARALLPLLIDLVVPVTAYYVLRGLGVSPLWALVLGGLPTAGYLLLQTVRSRRIDALGIFVLALLALGTAVSFITGSPRFLLAKGGWFTAAIGLAFLVTLVRPRPLAFTFARGMLNRTPALAERFRTSDWDLVWEEQPRFRRVWRRVTLFWGAGLLVDAALRVAMAYALPVDAVPGLSGGLAAVTIVLLQAGQQVYFRRTGVWHMLG